MQVVGQSVDPDTFGTHYGAWWCVWGCYHAYTYEVVDPIFTTRTCQAIVMTVPVDGGTAMLSTNRYNAWPSEWGSAADAGALPKTTTCPRPGIYEPIPEEDYLFRG